MLGRSLPRRAIRRTEGNWDIRLTAGHIAELRCLVTHLIPAAVEEAGKFDLYNRPHASHSSADAGAGVTCLRNWGVADAFRTKFIRQSTSSAESANPYI